MSAALCIGYIVSINVMLTVRLNGFGVGANANTGIETDATYVAIHSNDPGVFGPWVCQWART